LRWIVWCVVSLSAAVLAAHADAAVFDYLGQPVAEVHLQSNGVELHDPLLIEIVDTKAGQPLQMADVRETLAHLFGLGRYQDIQVDATFRGTALVLTYTLIPVQIVRRVTFQGSLDLPESELRRAVVDRYGASPAIARSPQVVATLQSLYRTHGFARAQITPRTEAAPGSSDATLVFSVDPGPRARIAEITVSGTPLNPPPALLNKLDLRTGESYDGVAIDTRLTKYADQLREQGYYEATVTQLSRFVDDDRAANLVLNVDPGPRVELTFEGDPLTERERDELVPVAREHSVDEDILEDSKFNIERHFRLLGYCNPRADYQRTGTSSVLTIAFTITRGPKCVLQQLQITGNESISEAELLPLIRTPAGAPFIDDTLGADTSRIVALYRGRGFAAAKATPEVQRGAEQGGTTPVRVRLVIAEGPRSIVQSVGFEGNSAIASDVLRPVVRSAACKPYFEPQVNSDADLVTQLYLNRGYPQVAIQPRPQPSADRTSVDVIFTIREGPQVIIDHVLIVGNTRTKTETIAREVQIKSGQPMSQQDEDITRSRLSALGVFRRVDISYLQLPGVETRRDALITVEEAPLTTMSYGGGVEGGRNLTRGGETLTQRGATESFYVAPRGSFQIGRRNVFGRDASVNLFTRVAFLPRDPALAAASGQAGEGGYGFNEYLARLSYAERTIFATGADGTFTGGVEQTRRSSFYFNRRGLSAALERRVRRIYAVSGRYALDRTRVFDIQIAPKDRPLIDRLFPQVRLSTISGSVIRDTRDDALDPGAGGLVGVDGELAARNIGSEVGFFKTFLQGFAYRRLSSSRVVAAFGARVGLATGFPRTITTTVDGETVTQVVDDLPASERFFAGGDTTVRGFALDRLGRPDTIDSDGFPKGGHGLVVLNAELRTPVRGSLGAVAFVDGGNVFLHVNDIDLSELRGTVGFGLRYRSPIGPIRVDLGFKLDRLVIPNAPQERRTALHISLGQAF